METFTVVIDGEEYEVSTDQIQEDAQVIGPDEEPDGYVSEDVAEARRKRAEKAAKEGMVSIEDAVENPQVVDRVLDEHGGKDIDPDSVKQEVREKEVEPLKDRLQKRNQATINQALINAARDVGVKDEFLRGDTPYVLHEFGDQLEFDEDRGKVVALDEEGNLMAGEEGVAGPKDLLKKKQGRDTYSHLFQESEPQKSGGSNDPGSDNGGGSNKEWTRSEIESLSAEEYAENRDEILQAAEEDRIREE